MTIVLTFVDNVSNIKEQFFYIVLIIQQPSL